MRNLLRILGVASMLFGMNAAAQDTRMSARACAGLDLSGTYVMIDFKETPPSHESAWRGRFKYEYIAFADKMPFYNITTRNREFHSAADAQKALGPLSSYKKYTLDQNGTLRLYKENDIIYSCHCTVSNANAEGYVKGDIILTGFSQHGDNEFYKLYRHWF